MFLSSFFNCSASAKLFCSLSLAGRYQVFRSQWLRQGCQDPAAAAHETLASGGRPLPVGYTASVV